MNHIIRVAIAAILCGALVSSPVQADTYWSDSAPASVTDLLNADYWSNGAPVTADNPGFITGQTITVSSNFDPGTEGQVIDLTFNGNNSTSMSGRFVPLANLASNKAGSVTFRLADTANVYVSGNFWGGTNDGNRIYKDFNLFQYYGGNSTFSSNEWWSGMTAKTKIIISDNAVVTARGGSASGLGWDDAAYGSTLEMSGSGKLNISSTNLNFYGNGTTANMYDNSAMSAKTLNIANGAAKVNLYDNSKLTATDINISSQGALALSGDSTATASNNLMVSNTGNISLSGNSAITVNNMFKLDNQSVLIANDNAKLTVTKDAALDRDGAITVNDDAQLTFGAQLKIGDVNAGSNGGAVFNQTGGKVTVASNTFFSYHKDATVNLSGGEFIASGTLYGSDQSGIVGNVNMSGNAYLKAKTLAWGQHGVTNITMTDNAKMEATGALELAYHFDAADLAQTNIDMSGNSSIVANGNLITFNGLGVQKRTGANKGYVSIVMKDNASFTVNGNFWGGTNNNSYSPKPLDGNTYVQEMTFSGNSSFSAQKEWWVSMTAKTKVLIEDNASISSGSGTSGLGCYSSGEGSLLTMTGGSIQVNNWYIYGSTMNMSGSSFLKARGNLVLDKTNPVMTVADDAVIQVTGTTYIGNEFDSTATFTQTGGLVQADGTVYFSFHENSNIDISGGKFIANGAQLYVTDQKGKTANITMSGDGYLQAKDLRLSQHGNTNLTMSENSQIKVTDINMAFNHTAGDNAVSVVTMDGSSNITANNMYFFGSNVNGAAYGSLTLNDNASVIIANETQVGKGSTISLLDGKTCAAEITLNDNSEFTSRTYTATAGAKSQTTVNGSATFNSDAIDIGPESEFNINGGSVNLITLVNAGTVNLAGGAVNLNQYGLITSTDGTFNANGGAINLTTPSNVSSGDQVIVGLFSDVNTANSVADKTVVPEGWQTSVTTVNDKGVVVANYVSAPAGEFKVWKENASGSMGDDSNWEGDFSNPTGFVISGTNSLSGITGKTIIVDGTNTLSGTTPTGASLVISGGTANYNNAVIEGNVFVNGGTFNNNGRMDIGLNASNDGKASFTQTGGTVTVSGLTFFACHADADVILSGGKYIANGDQLYVTDQRGCKADISMSGNAYLQAKDLRLSQHGTTNLNMSGDSHLKVTAFNLGYNYSAGDNVETVITMSDNSKLETGNFVSFAGNNDRNHSGAAYASFTMTDNAYVYASGNTWGGSNDGSNVAGLVSGKTYNLEMTFKGNSYFSTGEFWMAMAGKVHVTIEDNATVIARSGSSGLGWCEKTDGSLLEIKGGTLQIDSNNFLIGHTSTNANTGRSNVQQTGGTAIYKIIEIRHKDSGYYISGDNSVMTSGSVSTVAGSTLSIAGGTVNIGTLTNGGTLDLSGGTLNVGEGGISASGSYAVNLSGGVISTNGASWNTTSTVNATVADNSTVTFEPEAGQTIKWTGAFVNSSQNAQIVKSGSGTLKIDSPDQNSPTKLDSFVVNAGELDFKGYFVGDIEVENGSVMSPGNSIGTLYETGNFNLDPGATLLMEIAGSSVDDNDQLIVTGDINIGSGSIIDVVLAAGSSLVGNDSFSAKLTSTNAGAIIDDVMGALSSYYFKDLNYEYNSEGGYYQITGILDANAVPEPSTWGLLILGVVVLFLRKRVRS